METAEERENQTVRTERHRDYYNATITLCDAKKEIVTITAGGISA